MATKKAPTKKAASGEEAGRRRKKSPCQEVRWLQVVAITSRHGELAR